MEKQKNWLQWIDDNILKFLVSIYIFLIPLYPKFPIRIIDYTYIAVRAEDIYVAVLALIFIIQLLRRKVILNKQFMIPFAMFWGAIVLSFLFNGYITGSVIYKHLGFLHTARRFEYMIIFFIVAATIRSRKDFAYYMYLIMTVVGIVSVYGLGQKYAGWPAVQTMNPEFAKGALLYLTPEARVSSTFAGHYDLAAYLVLLIPVLLGFFFTKKRWIIFAVFIVSVFTLMLTASRVSYGAYIISTFGMLLYTKKFRYFFFVLLLTAGLTYVSTNLTSRFFKTIQIKQIFVNEKTGQVVVPQKTSSKELPAGTFYIPIKDQQQTAQQTAQTDALLKQKLIEDLQSEASRSGRVLTSTEAAMLAATQSAGLKEVSTVVSDISLATRLQVEWPRAIHAFLKNPVLGTGPSSITESTDNDYLRWIGEFGALGTLTFLYIIYLIVRLVLPAALKNKEDDHYIMLGFLFGLLGLMINASYIDVFEASKVAYTFWLVAGIYVGYLSLKKVN